MHPYLESILILDGVTQNLEGHLQRMNRTRWEVYGFSDEDRTRDELMIALERLLRPVISGKAKARIPYGRNLGEGDIAPYRTRRLESALLVDVGDWDYPHKRTDRSVLNEFGRRARDQGFDDALLVKDGLIRDFTYANVVFQCWDGHWVTPAQPLLNGTRRSLLLSQGRIEARDVRVDDLDQFKTVSAVNALVDLGEVTFLIDALSTYDALGKLHR